MFSIKIWNKNLKINVLCPDFLLSQWKNIQPVCLVPGPFIILLGIMGEKSCRPGKWQKRLGITTVEGQRNLEEQKIIDPES